MSVSFDHPPAALSHAAPAPALGSYAEGYAPIAACFARQLADGAEIGAGLCVHHRGRPVVDVWGGTAEVATGRAWEYDTRVVLFSVTKGLTAMALHLLADRGQLDWNAPVADYWPGFAQHGKAGIPVATLLNHRAGLPSLSTKLTLDDCLRPERAAAVRQALEAQRPLWPPGQGQGYHATTFGMYARELFERIAGEPLGPFLRRELFEPLGSDVWVGAPATEERRVATIYPPTAAARVGNMLLANLLRPSSIEARVAREVLRPRSIGRGALLNPDPGPAGVGAYDRPAVRQATLAWASATGSARGLSRAYLPFAAGGLHDDRRYLQAASLHPVYERQGWSDRDLVLQKPLGWSHGFLKEEPNVFGPTREAFGHPGLGGALGWCDPVHHLTLGYVMNRLDWRVRSPRALALCRALYACDPIRTGGERFDARTRSASARS
jgi:CubicO group peptidase (beta-lactamase class C family)